MNNNPLESRETEEYPWMGHSDWYKYRCRSCNHTDWIEDIVVDAFPSVEPEGVPALICPECGGDTSEPIKSSLQHPDRTS